MVAVVVAVAVVVLSAAAAAHAAFAALCCSSYSPVSPCPPHVVHAPTPLCALYRHADARCKLDYLLVLPHRDGREITLVVVDAKATDHVKLGARVQVAFYSLALKALLATRSIRARREQGHRQGVALAPLVPASFGAIWLYGQCTPTTFSLNDLERTLSTMMTTKLRRILTKTNAEQGYKTQQWHLGNHCFGCEYLASCSAEAVNTKGLHAISNLTKKQRLHLESLVFTSRAPLTTTRSTSASAIAPATWSELATLAGSPPLTRRSSCLARSEPWP